MSDKDIFMREATKEERELIENYIKSISEEMQIVKHAHWKWDEDGVDWNIGAWVCSNCGLMFPDFDIATNKNRRIELWAHSKYCGHCGAKMDEKVVAE